MQRDNYICRYCGARATEVDRMVPWSQGGPTVGCNLVAACQPCNREKGDRTLTEWKTAKRLQSAQPIRLRVCLLRKVRRIPGYRPVPSLAETLALGSPTGLGLLEEPEQAEAAQHQRR